MSCAASEPLPPCAPASSSPRPAPSSAFKQKFYDERLSAANGQAVIHTPVGGAAPAVKPAAVKVSVPPLPLEQYESVVATWKDLKWRVIPKPGGATMKPDLWYKINGARAGAGEGGWGHKEDQK